MYISIPSNLCINSTLGKSTIFALMLNQLIFSDSLCIYAGDLLIVNLWHYKLIFFCLVVKKLVYSFEWAVKFVVLNQVINYKGVSSKSTQNIIYRQNRYKNLLYIL